MQAIKQINKVDTIAHTPIGSISDVAQLRASVTEHTEEEQSNVLRNTNNNENVGIIELIEIVLDDAAKTKSPQSSTSAVNSSNLKDDILEKSFT